MLNKFDLRFADFLQDEGTVDLAECEMRYQKSQSTLKRCVYRLNDYLPIDQVFTIENNQVHSRMNRTNYEELCLKLELKDYSTRLGERILYILFTGFFRPKVNTTKIYETLGLSLTTKKKDSRKIKKELKEMGLYVENHYRKGIAIHGAEEHYRNYIALKLSNIVELDREDNLMPRKANSPIQKLVYNSFVDELQTIHIQTKQRIQHLLEEKDMSVDYLSKKFLYIYYALTTFRINKGASINSHSFDMVKVPEFSLFEHQLESEYMDYVMASLNYEPPLRFPRHPEINKIAQFLITLVEQDYRVIIYTKQELFEAVYAYIYKCHVLNNLGYTFYDHKLERTHIELESLYTLVKERIENHQDSFMVQFNRYQLAVICLILETYILRNQIAGEGTKRIVVITNSSIEKIHFFEEKLKQFVEFEIIGYATINELYKLEDLDYDEIIVFSSRIRALLLDHGYSNVRINFYMQSSDVKKLMDASFTSNQNAKLHTEEIIEQLSGKSEQEKIRFLKQAYKDYFL